MRLDKALQLSTYLTVALAGASLTYAEESYLPGLTLTAILLAILLMVAYFVEGRWWLSTQTVNGLAILISLIWIVWVTFYSSELDDPFIRPTWPGVFLPYFGPLLMVLVLVKLFRPKTIRDYWLIQVICLIEVAVGSVLVVEAEYGLWLAAYMVCAPWSIGILYMHRASLGATSISSHRLPWRHLGIWAAVRKAGVVGAMALFIFMLTPQHGTTDIVSEIRSRTAQSGFSNTIMDLNDTGRLEIDESVAFEIYAENADGTPKSDLSSDVHWRGLILDHYSKGRWEVQPSAQMNFTLYNAQRDLPHISADEFFINFHINTARSRGLFLAEPVVVEFKTRPNRAPELTMPYVSQNYEGKPRQDLGLFNYLQREDFVAGVVPFNPIQIGYRQVTEPAPADGLSRRSPLSPEKRSAGDWEKSLTRELLDQPVPGIRDFTKELLAQLVKEGKLTENDLRRAKPPPGGDPDSQSLVRVNRAKVARTVSDYLAYSGEFSYSLNSIRQDKNLDPTEDYLRNVKEGHCERTATGLVLMLRSAGIPSRLVVGYRGADPRNSSDNDDGWYVIRQSHAHTWVEALVGVETPDHNIELRWLTLDPSPATALDSQASFSWASWWQRTLGQLRNSWRVYILEYNADQLLAAVNAIWIRIGLGDVANWIQRKPYWLAGLTVMVVGLVWLRPKFRSRLSGQQIDPETAFYHRLLGLLSRNCRLAPKVGQTPQEFGHTIQDYLTRQNLGADMAELPARVIRLFYQVRYGRLHLSLAQHQEIDRQLDHFGLALKKTPRIAN
jgi:transglutaminase-like putative cysteine protease